MATFRRSIGLVIIACGVAGPGWHAMAGEGRREAADAESSEAEAVRAARVRYAGTWRVVAVESDGNRTTQDVRSIVVTNELDGSWTLTVDGDVVNKGTSRIDPLASPPEIDLEITEGDGKGGKLLAIYEVTDTTRRLCFRDAGGWRPREFATSPGCGATLVEFERQ